MLKRFFDISLVLISLPITLPIICITYLLLQILQGRPVFFKQKRIGKNNKEFTLIKFRTMKSGNAPDHERMTRIGNICRKLSIDELPEIFNILLGQMSIVGPRPLPTNYLEYYSDEELKRHSVLPGLTGLAQINGRNAISWRNKFKFDIDYVNNNNIWIDFKIILKTFLTLARISTVNASENITMMPLTERLHIIGAGGHAKVVIELAQALGREINGIYDTAPNKVGSQVLGYTVKDQSEVNDNALRIIAIGSQKIRKELVSKNHRYETLIHPASNVSRSVILGAGSVVFKGANIQADTRIGNHVIINTGTNIDHDCILEDFVHIAPGSNLCGGVTVKESTLIGVGSTIIPLITVEAKNIVAAGSIIVDNIDEQNQLWAGCPASLKKDLK